MQVKPRMSEKSVIIVGAGAAGLAAATDLLQQGVRVSVLDARDIPGGRMRTLLSNEGGIPIELGAEFIHGKKNETWNYIRKTGLRTHHVPGRHWKPGPEGLMEDKKFWDELAKVSERYNDAAPDQDFRSFLDSAWSLSAEQKRLATDYVEGFHAADSACIGVHALAKAEQAAEREAGTEAYRVEKGYAALVEWFVGQLRAHEIPLHLNTNVKVIRWNPGSVRVEAGTPAGLTTFNADCAVITLPLGVLQATGPEGVRFEPELPEKRKAIQSLAMGKVVKLTLQFRSKFWPVRNFGFVHATGDDFHVWWSDKRGPMLTGWAGGPKAERLEKLGRAAILEKGIQSLSKLFKLERQQIKELLMESHFHDWSTDPFTRGAYSYTPARMSGMPAALAAPVKGTLFFAGEATDANGEQGTVHGALASGKRAAAEILAFRELADAA
jgi:monoamine oxidase